MLKLLKWQSYKQASLAVHKVNYAVKMYKNVGFETVDENAEKYIMVCEPQGESRQIALSKEYLDYMIDIGSRRYTARWFEK